MENRKSRIIIDDSKDVDGFTLESILPQQLGKIIIRGKLTSFEESFHNSAKEILSLFNCSNINNLLIIFHENKEIEIFEDNFLIITTFIPKRNIEKGGAVYHNDIVDIVALSFHDGNNEISLKPGEKIIFIFRYNFAFGLYFDLTRKTHPNIIYKELAQLYRKVAYADIFNALNKGVIESLINIGWFPFIEIIGREHETLFSSIKENKKELITLWIENSFPKDRIDKLVDKWWLKRQYREKKELITEGINCYINGQYFASISTLIPMVEGLVNTHNIQNVGKGVGYGSSDITNKLNEITTGTFENDSLTLPGQFKIYLDKYYFKHNKGAISGEAVRNTVSHGRAQNESFTKENTLKVILTLDQIWHYF